MQFVYYTVTALLLYFFSDWILLRMEKYHGKPFENRSIYFFVIILILAVSSFKAIELLLNR